MAVYTHLGAEELAALIAHYPVGDLVSAKGIAEGVSNSNWLIDTAGKDGSATRFILTMYERRIELEDLPYFLGLLDHLSAKGCPVPRTIHDRDGASFRMLDGKAVALIEFLPGVSPTEPEPAQACAVGETLARIHAASADFGLSRTNTMSFADNLACLEKCGGDALGSIHPDLPAMLEPAREAAALDLSALPQAQIHADLFPDNVLMLGDKVTGLIDFYFACTGAMALDLAVTHAAWCFDGEGKYVPALGEALVKGYKSVRALEQDEQALLPQIAKGAAIRFVASRAEDWLDTPDDALVTRKDPMQFVARWRFYNENGADVFA
ncbi:homoserine kinase [Erythrobacter sp. SCSIO 43205]|uniref:homoserine kinase n=1 Tax=Erythrobacter sp. SCSIO 43205 TaxID=2779361 RepID=UPI001CA87AFC|nr:homoserine kinase [Erythrobacter sp. SCSIO 43205]UAB79125.1 homoserine kinase [Erythrobacter sp. SCSIO 43205]